MGWVWLHKVAEVRREEERDEVRWRGREIRKDNIR